MPSQCQLAAMLHDTLRGVCAAVAISVAPVPSASASEIGRCELWQPKASNAVDRRLWWAHTRRMSILDDTKQAIRLAGELSNQGKLHEAREAAGTALRAISQLDDARRAKMRVNAVTAYKIIARSIPASEPLAIFVKLDAAQEEVNLLKELATEVPKHRLDLATALRRLAAYQSGVRQPIAAYQAMRESAAIMRELVQEDEEDIAGTWLDTIRALVRLSVTLDYAKKHDVLQEMLADVAIALECSKPPVDEAINLLRTIYAEVNGTTIGIDLGRIRQRIRRLRRLQLKKRLVGWLPTSVP